VQKGSKFFPHSSFSVLDLTRRTTNNEERRAKNEEQTACWAFYDSRHALVRISEADYRYSEHRNRMSNLDRLLVVQNLPPCHSAFVGKDVLPGYFPLIQNFQSYFVVDRHIWYEDRLKSANDNWFIGLFSLKDKS
jgi:hypothetical protein